MSNAKFQIPNEGSSAFDIRHSAFGSPPLIPALVIRVDITHASPMDLAASFESVRARVREACIRANREPSSVEILAVSKGQAPETVKAAYALGQLRFGENKVQEAKVKIPLCPSPIRWHMIGHLQTNKCREAVHLFEMIHSVDSLRLAEELQKEAQRASRTVPVLLEVNLAGESSKFGYAPDRLLAEWDSLNALSKLEIHGLMTMAPWTQDPEKVRPVFRGLRELKLKCEDRLGAPLPHLSMGMSGDFEVAIEEGATLVRLGTCLFGARTWKPRQSDP